jgi:phosphoribosylformylglycinamidine synthase
MAGGLGATVLLKKIPFKSKLRRDDVILFSESNSRLIAEVNPKNEKALIKIFKGLPIAKIGNVEASPELVVYGLKDQPVINAPIDELKEIWKSPLR